MGNHNSFRVSKISGSKPAGGLTSVLDLVSLKWGNLEQPADKVVAELNGKEDFTEYIQNVQSGRWVYYNLPKNPGDDPTLNKAISGMYAEGKRVSPLPPE